MEERKENTLHNPARTANELATSPGKPRRKMNGAKSGSSPSGTSRFVALEAKVLREMTRDDIHDMRVASRRLQQVLDLIFPKPLPREGPPLETQDQAMRRVAGDVRIATSCSSRCRTFGKKPLLRQGAWRLWSSIFRVPVRMLREGHSQAEQGEFGRLLHARQGDSGPAQARARPGPKFAPLGQPDRPALEPFPARLRKCLQTAGKNLKSRLPLRTRKRPRPPSTPRASAPSGSVTFSKL